MGGWMASVAYGTMAVRWRRYPPYPGILLVGICPLLLASDVHARRRVVWGRVLL